MGRKPKSQNLEPRSRSCICNMHAACFTFNGIPHTNRPCFHERLVETGQSPLSITWSPHACLPQEFPSPNVDETEAFCQGPDKNCFKAIGPCQASLYILHSDCIVQCGFSALCTEQTDLVQLACVKGKRVVLAKSPRPQEGKRM